LLYHLAAWQAMLRDNERMIEQQLQRLEEQRHRGSRATSSVVTCIVSRCRPHRINSPDVVEA